MKRRIETSKKLLVFCDILVVGVTAVTLYGWISGRDLTGTEPTTVGAYGLASVAHGFYYNKAKFENGIKLRRDNPEDYDAVAQTVKEDTEL